MAKRYIDYVNLVAHAGGPYKPGGTLGSHHCNLAIEAGGISVTSFDGQTSVHLAEGDTLGYDCGTIWRVPRPEEYRDPVRRALAARWIPQRALEYSTDSVEYSVSYGRSCRGSAVDTDTGDSIVVLGECENHEVPGTRWEYHPDGGSDRPPFGFRRIVTGGECIVVLTVVSSEATTQCRRRRVSRVIIRPEADAARVATWLLGI